LLVSLHSSGASRGLMAESKEVSAVEYLYADVSDASTILSAINSGLLSSYQGKDRSAWEQVYSKGRAKLATDLDQLPTTGLSAGDNRAITAMKEQSQAFSGGGAL